MADEVTDPPADGLEPRVEKLETGHASMSERIDKILGLLDKPADPAAPSVTTADPAPAADMAEQMREAVRAVHAERDAAAAGPDKPKPEVTPREAGQPARQKLQAALYGREPKR